LDAAALRGSRGGVQHRHPRDAVLGAVATSTRGAAARQSEAGNDQRGGSGGELAVELHEEIPCVKVVLSRSSFSAESLRKTERVMRPMAVAGTTIAKSGRTGSA